MTESEGGHQASSASPSSTFETSSSSSPSTTNIFDDDDFYQAPLRRQKLCIVGSCSRRCWRNGPSWFDGEGRAQRRTDIVT